MQYTTRCDSQDRIRLSDFDPDENGGLKKEDGIAKTIKLGAELCELQDLLFEAGANSLLIILQGRDTSGKDGAIRCLMEQMNAQGFDVAGFKVPTQWELAHDFLWRIHSRTPPKGHTTIFNRSQYEDVLAARVHKLVPKDVWQARFEHINNFERLLTDSSTIVAKFYLHISKEEQKERLIDREKDVEKSWKLSVGDWKERELWNDYTHAYEDLLSKCSTKNAPWHIVPANHKWYRNLAVVDTLVDMLQPYRKPWTDHLKEVGKDALAEIRAFRKEEGDNK